MHIVLFLKPKATVAYLYQHNTLRQGLEKMRAHGYTAIPVLTQDGRYAGTVSEGDLLWHMLNCHTYDIRAQEAFTIHDILRQHWNPAVHIDATMDDLLLRVMDQNFVPVVDDRNLFMGIITRRDVIRYFYDQSHPSQAARPTAAVD